MLVFETQPSSALFFQDKSSLVLKQSPKPEHVQRPSQVKHDLLLHVLHFVKYHLENTVISLIPVKC